MVRCGKAGGIQSAGQSQTKKESKNERMGLWGRNNVRGVDGALFPNSFTSRMSYNKCQISLTDHKEELRILFGSLRIKAKLMPHMSGIGN